MEKPNFFTKLFWILALLAASSLVLTSCDGDDHDPNNNNGGGNGGNDNGYYNGNGNGGGPTISVEHISLERFLLSLNLYMGNTVDTLIFTIYPANATNQAVVWESSNPDVAIVNTQGVVTAVSVGTATITVFTVDGGHTSGAQVTVVSCNIGNPAGVVINGIRWASFDVDAPGTFTTAPQRAGMFYQWNRNVGWSSTDPMLNSNGGTTWDSSTPSGTEWEAINCPCPAGWRVPTRAELQSLNNSGSTWVTNWNGTGVNGRIYGTYPNQIFLSASGVRIDSDGGRSSVGSTGGPWSSDRLGSDIATSLSFDMSQSSTTGITWRSSGLSVRCVSE